VIHSLRLVLGTAFILLGLAITGTDLVVGQALAVILLLGNLGAESFPILSRALLKERLAVVSGVAVLVLATGALEVTSFTSIVIARVLVVDRHAVVLGTTLVAVLALITAADRFKLSGARQLVTPPVRAATLAVRIAVTFAELAVLLGLAIVVVVAAIIAISIFAVVAAARAVNEVARFMTLVLGVLDVAAAYVVAIRLALGQGSRLLLLALLTAPSLVRGFEEGADDPTKLSLVGVALQSNPAVRFR